MKYVSILEPPAKKFVEMIISKMGLDPNKFINKTPPQEDFFCVSKKYPIFVAADGVTLIQFLLDEKEYPNPSPAGDVARIFCENALKAAEELYESFNESDVKEVFRIGNEAVGEYNRAKGRTKQTIDYWSTDFYAATAALAVVKENQACWGSICDSYIMHFNSEGETLFKSPDCRSMAEEKAPEFTGDLNDRKEKIRFTWRVTRNGVNENGKRIGYGVITGEPEALFYVSSGNFEIKKGDLISVLTDGFEEYMKLPEFISVFKTWPKNIELITKEFLHEKEEEDLEKFGHERTLIMIPV